MHRPQCQIVPLSGQPEGGMIDRSVWGSARAAPAGRQSEGETVQAIFGIVALTALAWLMSEDRRVFRAKMVLGSLALQVLLALLFLRLPGSKEAFAATNHVVDALQAATAAGTGFVFGYLGGAPAPFAAGGPGSTFILAFNSLPLVLVVSALSALLYYWRVLPVIVKGFAWALNRTLGVSGPVGLSTAANVFVGMVEAPLLIRPYLSRMDRGDLFLVMVGGMAGIAGTMLVLYATMLAPLVPNAAGHLITSSVITAPAAIMVAALMVPPSPRPQDQTLSVPRSEAENSMDAITRGTTNGITLLLNIVAMLIVLVALVTLLNTVIGLLPDLDGKPLTLQRMTGWLMSPVAWLMGIPWNEAQTAGGLLGTKVILNELLAYMDMAALPDGALSPHSRLIMTYALCGFANFGSLGIMIGGMGVMAPDRRSDIVSLGLKSIIAGTIATCMTAAIAGLIV
jgi:CNT family concentrative nucleoside transporter